MRGSVIVDDRDSKSGAITANGGLPAIVRTANHFDGDLILIHDTPSKTSESRESSGEDAKGHAALSYRARSALVSRDVAFTHRGTVQ